MIIVSDTCHDYHNMFIAQASGFTFSDAFSKPKFSPL